jgi:hypothetical protein
MIPLSRWVFRDASVSAALPPLFPLQATDVNGHQHDSGHEEQELESEDVVDCQSPLLSDRWTSDR